MKKLIFEMSYEGRSAFSLPKSEIKNVEINKYIPTEFLRKEDCELPQVSEVDAIRHFTHLSQRNFGVDQGFYPLGSCTMKYNPKINEDIARYSGFINVHPYQPVETTQGALKVLYDLDLILSEITGMDKITLQPAAGAHGEMTGLMIIKAYHEKRNDKKRTKIICPDSAHGTNPASAAISGFEVITVHSNEKGLVDIDDLKQLMSEEVAGLMLTNPNTLGLFEEEIISIAQIVHEKGGLLYYDGANANAILSQVRPGDMGFDVVHLNLHKTFSTPHGGGGPGSGPVGVKAKLIPFIPVPVIEKNDNGYYLNYNEPDSIGKVRSFYGNFLVALRAYAYILTMGPKGLKQVSENAVLNANYLLSKLKKHFDVPFGDKCMHEFVISGQAQKEKGASTLDMAKRLLDYGYHPPTIYFPLIVKEAMMIEPTETEGKETLDEFIKVMESILQEIDTNVDIVHNAPNTTVVKRLDEVQAARKPILKY